jgi:Penicillin binding protein transpeptidase domain
MTDMPGDAGQEGSYYRPGGAPGGAQPGPEYGDFPLPISLYSPPPERRRTGCIALISIGAVAAALIAGVAIVKALPGKGSPDTAGFHPTAKSPSADAKQLVTAFLRAWSSGNLGEAANLTDDPLDAEDALTAYRQGLNLRKLTGTVTGTAVTSAPAVPAGMTAAGAQASTTLETVTFTLNATVADSASSTAMSGTWSYRSSLTAYRVPNGSGWFIQWLPSVVAPNVAGGQELAAVSVPPGDTSVTDSAGNPLSSYNDPGLGTVANLLMRRAPTKPGSSGLSVQVEDASDGTVAGNPTTIIAPKGAGIATTISPAAEQAARDAVSGTYDSAIVVEQPSTGDILAIANNAQFNDYALTATVPPGSTMKIITSTALINSGVVSENSPVACPSTYTVQGVVYHNDDNESEPAGTPFSTDFAQSCNNAFAQWWPQLNGQLASTAQTYYGLNQQWNIGIPGESASYFNAPASASGSELAEETFGEGLVTASPLAMASVAATVDTGQFRQPVLLPGLTTVSAQPLPPGTDAQLKDMMRDVVTEGTAETLGLGPDIYAKTGTADVQGQGEPDSWMVAFDPDENIAIAALVVDGGDGAQVAGPEVKTFFDDYRA